MTTTGADRCGQPGCSGTLLDGYCDVCGMAPATGSADTGNANTGNANTGNTSTGSANTGNANQVVEPRAQASVSRPPPVDGAGCGQPGCSGTIRDGYCDVCGMAGVSTGSTTVGLGSTTGGLGSTTGGLGSTAGGAGSTSAEGEVGLLDGGGSVATSASRVQSAAFGSARTTHGSGATRRTRAGLQRMRAARLGAGLTRVPPAPPVDAATAIDPDPVVPESKRTCSNCGTAIGRSRDGAPGREEGFCPQCGQEFSFTVKLQSGDLVAGQYEVAGALAHGGLGWIYLARDKNVSDRWVVLKGLLNSGDPDALAAAIAEQQFLAQVEHPLIVEIFNFVTHEGAGYIVMEFVGGRSLKQLLKQRMSDNAGRYDPLPVEQALAYVHEVLPAFQYLHDLGLVYCDFKPDNLIQVGDGVKLIDLGGVRRIDDDESAIYGTVGYQAPEVAEVGPSVASDIYTVGRTLVVLTLEFRGYQGTYLHSLPPPEEVPLFAENDSFYWLVSKCCAPDPADRFASADELRTQVHGIMREMVAKQAPDVATSSATSLLFDAPASSESVLGWRELPGLQPDTHDPQHAFVVGLAVEPEERLRQLRGAADPSPEVRLAEARAALEAGDIAHAKQAASDLLAADPWEWRALWMEGLAALADEAWNDAIGLFSAVCRQVPGEVAPKLALAVACERGDRPEVAEGLYHTCAQTDAAYVAIASFGMARVRAMRGDTTGAVNALDQVPPTSRGYVESRRMRADVLLAGGDGRDLAVLDQAMRTIEGVSMDATTRRRYVVRILEQALSVVRQGSGAGPDHIGSFPATERSLRDGLEQTFRSLARDATRLDERIELVNRANDSRNWTLT